MEPLEYVCENTYECKPSPCSFRRNEIDRNLDELKTNFIQNLDIEPYVDAEEDTVYDMLESLLDPETLDMFQQEEHQQFTFRVPTAKCRAPRYDDLCPTTIMLCGTINEKESNKLLRVLFDSGSRRTMIHQRALPKGATPVRLDEPAEMSTLAGTHTVKGAVRMKGIHLPELDKNRIVDKQDCLVFNSDCRYDMILGQDFLRKTGIDLRFSTGKVEWLGNDMPMRDPAWDQQNDTERVLDQYGLDEEDDFFAEALGEDCFDSFLSHPILDPLYERVDTKTVVEKQQHLTKEQQADLAAVLSRHAKLFDGTLGKYPHKKMHIDVIDGAEPKHSRPYPVPRVHEGVFKRTLDDMVRRGVLEKQGTSEWAHPCFITPKKDGSARWIGDLRELNKVIKRRQYPLPIIHDILRRRSGYKYFTKLDISMQYYTFELDEESKDLCTLITPFGKYRYNRLPMGLKCSPDMAQEVMEHVLEGLDDSEVYIDDIGAFSNDWKSHLNLLDEILGRLRSNGFTVNPLKCEWAVKETDWLGYWLTPHGLKPWKKKIEAILQLDRPKNIKQMRSFLGAVNYYRDMWPRRAHVLQPLSERVGKSEFIWTEDMDKAFKAMKALIAADAMQRYPNHNKPFVIKTDASKYQMGAVILQENKPVAYWSRKLNPAQMNYTTMEKELLSIVMVLKEYRSMLLGADLTVYTDHKNLTYANLNTERVLRWRLYLEEFSPTMVYIKGEENILADAYSRVPRLDDTSLLEGKNPPATVYRENDTSSPTNVEDVDSFYSVLDDPELFDCFLNLPTLENNAHNPLNYTWIQEEQQNDAKLQTLVQKNPQRYFTQAIGFHNIICHVKPGDPQSAWKIALPDSVINPLLRWYHQVLGHPGEKRLHAAVSQRYHHHELRRHCDRFVCDACQRHKLDGRGYGLLPERDVQGQPFTDVAVDLIGPWNIEIEGQTYEFNALTCIDPVTNLTELTRVDRKTSRHITRKFEQTWLSRYPWPRNCIHDNGGEFTGWEFQQLLQRTNIKDKPTTSRNPTANAICERMHQTVGNVLRTLLYTNPPRNLDEASDLVDDALATAMHAMRTNVATTLGSSPGALVFSRDMFLDIPLTADWQIIQQRREQLVNEDLRRKNAKRIRFDYAQGQRVLKKRHKPNKLGLRTEGPYEITRVHTNGTITIQLRQGVTERINIRRVIPYNEPT